MAQTVSHVMLDHMSSSRVMHGDGRWHGEKMVKYKVKKKNIAAVHAWYHNNHLLFSWQISNAVSIFFLVLAKEFLTFEPMILY